jgi:hypothetical protein
VALHFWFWEAEGGAHHAFRGGIQIGRRHDDGRVLAAELEETWLDPAGAETGVDPHPDRLRAREHHAVHPGVLPERIADRVAVTDQQVEHTRREPGVPVHLVQPESGPRRVFGGLVYHGVARRERGRGHPGRERQREVEWGDAGEDAVRPQHVGVPLHRRDAPHRADKPSASSTWAQ